MSENQFTIKSVTPTLIEVEVKDLQASMNFNIGSYIKIPIEDKENDFLIGIIESYNITTKEEDNQPKVFVLNVQPIGTLFKNENNIDFKSGFIHIPIPPIHKMNLVEKLELEQIYNCNLKKEEKFIFSKLSQNNTIEVPINGNRFFNKHIAIVGATGSGKSYAIAKILQNVINTNKNNSHFVIFDLHSEYHTAFPTAKIIGSNEILVPYWLFSFHELEELFEINTEKEQYISKLFYAIILQNKIKHFKGNDKEKQKIEINSMLYFDIEEVHSFFVDKNSEMEQGSRGLKQGEMYGKLTNFIEKFERILKNKRMNFIFNQKTKASNFQDILQMYVQPKNKSEGSNITIIDLGGLPFEIVNIAVSFISRILFEFAYNYKRITNKIEVPILLVFEEAHKYVPQSDLVKYRASKHSIERIAKEGRKYGISLLIASQRPSDVSTTIFAQCNNFIAMRLTNPEDQNYVKKLLPDTLAWLTNNLPILRTGEALLFGDAIQIPSIVQIDRCKPEPSSSDIPYLEKWSEQWKDIDFDKIVKDWEK